MDDRKYSLVTFYYGDTRHTVVGLEDEDVVISPDENVVLDCIGNNGKPTMEVFRRGWDRISITELS